MFLATHTLGTFTMSYFKMGPTELRILLSIGCLVLLVKPYSVILGHRFLLFDVGGRDRRRVHARHDPGFGHSQHEEALCGRAHPANRSRVARFLVVGALGVAVQLVTLDALTRWVALPYLWATTAAVTAAVVHNFLWHRLWTWRERHDPRVFRVSRNSCSPTASYRSRATPD